MKPRLEAIKSKSIRIEREVFDLEITNYEEASQVMEDYLTKEYEECYEYPLYSFVFYPPDSVSRYLLSFYIQVL